MQKSGTRLRRRLQAPVGGADARFVGWYDTERKEECAYGSSARSARRCVPPLTSREFGAVFTNSRCSGEPIAGLASTDCPSAYVEALERLDGGAPDRLNLHPLGAELSGRPAVVYGYIGTQDSCRSLPSQFASKFHALGAAVPQTAFVESTVVRTTRTLTAVTEKGSDGSEHVSSFALPAAGGAQGIPCTVEVHKDGSLHCMDTARPRPLFSTSDCTGKPTAWASSQPRTWLVVPAPTSCNANATAIFQTVELNADAGTLYAKDTGSCAPADPAPSARLYTLGQELPSSSYPTVSTALGGAGPLRAALRNVDGYVEVTGWIDTTHDGVPCDFIKTLEGKWRCIPGARMTASYLDATCTTASPTVLYDYPAFQCGGPAVTQIFVSRVVSAPCTSPEVLNVYRGAVTTQPVFDKLPDGSCVPAQTTRFSSTDDEVPIQQFVEGNTQVE